MTSDPDRIAAAYGVSLPPPGAPERVAVGLCPGTPARGVADRRADVLVHGDISAKNVLWSLSPAPAVYVLDCDDAAVTGVAPTELASTGVPASPSDSLPAGDRRPAATEALAEVRPRATTPNWDDPALTAGDRPNEATDRYALGLVFLPRRGRGPLPPPGAPAGDGGASEHRP